MNLPSIFRIGDKLIIRDGKNDYTSSVDDIIDEQSFSILQPFFGSRAVQMEDGRVYRIICIKAGGIHEFDATAIRTELSGQVMVTFMQFAGNYIRLQRRNAYRCPMMLNVQVRMKYPVNPEQRELMTQTSWEQTKTMDVSEEGMCVRLSSKYRVGDLVECIMEIDKYGIWQTLPTITGKIVRSIPGRTGEQTVGIHLLDIDEKVRSTLLKLVTLGQRDRLGH